MERLVETMQPLRQETRVLAMAGEDEVLRAVLGPAVASHPRAAPTLVDALSLWHQQASSVVLCADVEACLSARRRIDDFGLGVRTIHDDVEGALRAHRRRGRRLHGLGHFADLRRLSLEGV